MDIVKAAAALVRDEQGRVLLVQRGKDPEAGRWSIPGGKVEAGECLAETAAREVAEETGIDVRVGQEVYQLTFPIGDGRSFEIHDFVAEPIGGTLRAGDDAADVGWFTPDAIETLPLTSRLRPFLETQGVL